MMPPIGALQTASSTATGTQAGILLLVVAAAVVLIEALTGIEIITPVAGGVRRAIGMLPLPGFGDNDSGGGLFADVSMRTALAAAFAVAVLAVASGRIVQLPGGSEVQILVVLELIAVYLVLREFDAFSIPVYMVITVATVVVALSALGEPVMAALTMSPVWPILAVGLLYLGYKAIGAYRAANAPRYPRRPRR